MATEVVNPPTTQTVERVKKKMKLAKKKVKKARPNKSQNSKK
jgi:hypothetical protein